MEKQHTDKGQPPKGSVVMLDSYDVAQHKKTDKETTSIISFSSSYSQQHQLNQVVLQK